MNGSVDGDVDGDVVFVEGMAPSLTEGLGSGGAAEPERRMTGAIDRGNSVLECGSGDCRRLIDGIE